MSLILTFYAFVVLSSVTKYSLLDSGPWCKLVVGSMTLVRDIICSALRWTIWTIVVYICSHACKTGNDKLIPCFPSNFLCSYANTSPLGPGFVQLRLAISVTCSVFCALPVAQGNQKLNPPNL